MILIDIVNLLFGAFYILLLASILLSWVRPDPYHPTWGPIIRIVNGIVDPILKPIRRIMPPLGGLDFSPMIVLLLARVLQGAVVNLLR